MWVCCHSYTIIKNFDFSDLDYEMETCFLRSVALYFCFKKGFHRILYLIWFNKIFLSKIVDFFVGN